MATIAVVPILGKQYKICVGQKFWIDRVPYQEGKDFEVQDLLAGKKVKFKVLQNKKDQKIRILRFRAKSYSRRKGHRQLKSQLEVISIK